MNASAENRGGVRLTVDMSLDELRVLTALDALVHEEAVLVAIDRIVGHVEEELGRDASAVMAWQPIPLAVYGSALLPSIRSSWVFVLRAGATTGAERHPNSLQRVMSYRGGGDLQTIVDSRWRSNELLSDPQAPLERRWASIPVNVWHQAVVPGQNWVVVSFHTASEHELIEERPDGDRTRQRLYYVEGHK